MSAPRDRVAMERIYDAAQRRNRAARKVAAWVREQTAASRLVQNRDAPDWHDFREAERELQRAVYGCGAGVP